MIYDASKTMDEMEYAIIMEALAYHLFNVAQATRALGLTQKTIYNFLNKHGKLEYVKHMRSFHRSNPRYHLASQVQEEDHEGNVRPLAGPMPGLDP